MRLVIEFDEKYKGLFYEAVKATDSIILEEEPDFWNGLPPHVIAGIEKGLEQVKNGQTKTYAEVKKILAERFPKTKRSLISKNKRK
jgi:hypothetical protein